MIFCLITYWLIMGLILYSLTNREGGIEFVFAMLAGGFVIPMLFVLRVTNVSIK